MSDSSSPPLHLLGMADRPEPEQPSADVADATATAPATPDEEVISVDEALAALDDPDAPPQTQEEPEEPLAAATDLTAEQIAALVAENEAYKAKQAQAEAEQADAEYDATWDAYIANGEDFYQACAEIVAEWGEAQGRNAHEIKGLIAEVVDEGKGIEHINKIAAGRLHVPPGQPGFLAWQRQVWANRVTETKKYLATKSAPSVVDHLATTYGLDETDRSALAKFVNFPPEALEELAKTLGAKSARVSSTMSAATKDATRNVRSAMSNGIQPGAPGASPVQKRVQLDHTRKSTEYVARTLGLLRPTGS